MQMAFRTQDQRCMEEERFLGRCEWAILLKNLGALSELRELRVMRSLPG